MIKKNLILTKETKNLLQFKKDDPFSLNLHLKTNKNR